MKLDKETLMFFGGGLVLGYFVCKFMSKSTEKMSEPAPQVNAPVAFGADGLMRAGGGSPTPMPMDSTPLFGSTGNLNPKVSRRRIYSIDPPTQG